MPARMSVRSPTTTRTTAVWLRMSAWACRTSIGALLIAATVKTAANGKWTSNFQWNGPDWKNINNPDTSAVGFNKGAGLSADNSTKLDAFIAELAGGLNLWTGPINLQDKSTYLAGGVAATDQQIWYLPQLLEGMEGDSVAK